MVWIKIPNLFGLGRSREDAEISWNQEAKGPQPARNSRPEVISPCSPKAAQNQKSRSPLTHAKSRTIIRVISTTFRPREPECDEVPMPTPASKERREAALRERGLLPPRNLKKDLSRVEWEQDQLNPVTIPPPTSGETVVVKGGMKRKVSAALLVKQEWEAKNTLENMSQPPAREQVIIHSVPSPPFVSQPEDSDTIAEVDSPLPMPHSEELRPSTSRSELISRPPLWDQRSIPLLVSNNARLHAAHDAKTSMGLGSHAPATHSMRKCSPSPSALHSWDLDRGHGHVLSLLAPSSKSEPEPSDLSLNLALDPSSHMLTSKSASDFPAQNHRNKIPVMTENSITETVALDSNDLTSEGSSMGTENIHNKEGSMPPKQTPPPPKSLVVSKSFINPLPRTGLSERRSPPDRKRRIRLSASLSNMRQSIVNTFSHSKPCDGVKGSVFDASLLPPPPIAASSGEQRKSPVSRPRSVAPGPLHERPVRQRSGIITADVSVGARRAVAPPLYNRETIMLEASAIRDEESRRVTELAFLG